MLDYGHLINHIYEWRYLEMLFLHREDGQGLVEYALVLVLVAVVVIAILTLLGPQIGNVFSRITHGLQ
jgi:pilus assembly protein Flp/PilA